MPASVFDRQCLVQPYIQALHQIGAIWTVKNISDANDATCWPIISNAKPPSHTASGGYRSRDQSPASLLWIVIGVFDDLLPALRTLFLVVESAKLHVI